MDRPDIAGALDRITKYIDKKRTRNCIDPDVIHTFDGFNTFLSTADIEFLVARVKELEAANEWQPIETAPEYVWVLITHPKMKDRTDVTSCCARRYQGNWYSPEIWDTEATYSDEDVDPHPTHWRPLPSLPEGV